MAEVHLDKLPKHNEMYACYRGEEITMTERESLHILGILINACYGDIGDIEKEAARKFIDALTSHL